jgi:uncharacterized membrane protein
MYMNETSIFLSQLIGIVFVILGMSFFIRKSFYMEWFKHIELSQPVLFAIAIVELPAGLTIMLTHNYWDTPAQIIISLLGWLMALEGATNLLIDAKTLKHGMQHFCSHTNLNIAGIIIFGLGCYLSIVCCI